MTTSVAMPEELLHEIDRRAESLGLSRSAYLMHLARIDLRDLGPLIINSNEAKRTRVVELDEGALRFLLTAMPELAAYEQLVKSGTSMTDLPKPPHSVTKSKLWERFMEERGAILRYKWLESEKAHRDIGIEAAVRQWVEKHYEEFDRTHPVGGRDHEKSGGER